MRKFNCKWLPLVLLLVHWSCQRENIEPLLANGETSVALAQKPVPNTCPEFFYYYGESKINLGKVNTTQLIIGFQANITSAQKEEFIARYPYLQSIKSEGTTGSADIIIVTLTAGLTCAMVESALIELARQPEVRFATPFFKPTPEGNLLGLTNQFIVNLKPGYTVEDLEKYTKRTKTVIVEQLGDLTFIMSADKYATGNALQMANEFTGFYPVQSSEPDFYYEF